MEIELKCLEEEGRKMEADSEMLNMLAVVSGVRTKLKALMAQAQGKIAEAKVRSYSKIVGNIYYRRLKAPEDLVNKR